MIQHVDYDDIFIWDALTCKTDYVWEFCFQLPPGDYYTMFTVKYNSTPGAEEKVWKTHTFRMDFKVVDNNH